MKEVYQGAKVVTLNVTGKYPQHRQLVYGPRALEWVFDFGNIGGGKRNGTMTGQDINGDGKADNKLDNFKLAKALGIPDQEIPVRITELSDATLYQRKLEQCFGKDPAINDK